MNIGPCPYDGCTGTFMYEVPESTPAYALLECETCRREVWYLFSRLSPEAWTREAFEEAHTINHETREILPRASTASSPAAT